MTRRRQVRSGPTASSFERAFQVLVQKQVKTFFCTCNKTQTDAAAARLRSIVAETAAEVERSKAVAEGRTAQPRSPQALSEDYFKEITLFEVPAGVQTPGMHVIFVLDESRSMSINNGAPWNSLVVAYQGS